MIFDNFWQLWFFLEIVNHCEICLQAEGKGDKEEDFMYLWHHFLTRWNWDRIRKAQNRETHSQPQVWVLIESRSPIVGANVSSDDHLEQHPHPPWPHPLHGQVGQVAENTNQANFLGTSMRSSCGRMPPTRPTRRSRRWLRPGSRWSSGNQDHHHKD